MGDNTGRIARQGRRQRGMSGSMETGKVATRREQRREGSNAERLEMQGGWWHGEDRDARECHVACCW